MASTRDIRRRIKSVKNTSQITKAMQMVAAANMRKAQQSALSGRPYAELMNEVLAPLAETLGNFHHPLTDTRPVHKRCVILVSPDKGLCGALNGNLMREAAKYDRDTTVYITAGRKASQFIARAKRHLAAEFTYKDSPTFDEARAISKFAQELYAKQEVDEVEIIYTKFINTLNQKPQTQHLLPVGRMEGVQAGIGGDKTQSALLEGAAEFQYEPGQEQVLGALLPHSINFQIYQMLLESKASEQSARMVAMKNATDNAKQLIRDLTLEYNKLRQANITKELLEITSAAMALE
jgi:F-type H+-transporting ATPase subunit gamma